MISPMATLLGRTRDPWRVVWVGMATLGLGFAWYYFVAFREVDFQAGRRHSGLIILGLVPLIGWVFVMAYMVVELRRLRDDCARLGLPPPIGPGHHNSLVMVYLLPATIAFVIVALNATSVWWFILPAVLAAWSPAGAVPLVARDINGVWVEQASQAARQARVVFAQQAHE